MKTCLIAGLCAGCASSGEAPPGADETVDGGYYTLRTAPTVRHARPLPAQTDVLVDWHDAKGGTTTVTGFRGWDFMGDGRFQMVEVLGPDGKATSYVYDFDADGSVDKVDDVGR